MVAQTCLIVTLYIHCLTCSVFLDQFGYPLLYFPIDDVLTSCTCCQYFYYFNTFSILTQHIIPLQMVLQDELNKTVITVITFLPSRQ